MFSLSGPELSLFLVAMAALLAFSHLLGYAAERLYAPRVIGEVAAGLVLGPTLLGTLFPDAYHRLFLGFDSESSLFGLVYQLGLMMLMFMSGLKFQSHFQKDDARISVAIVVGSTVLPFLAGWFGVRMFDVAPFLGEAHNAFAMDMVIAISIAVTSIPVISKIFIDLGIMHSRFAKLIVAIAGVHDVLLWVVLGIATAAASHAGAMGPVAIGKNLLTTFAFIAVTLAGLTLLFHYGSNRKANVLFRSSTLGYFLIVLFAMSAVAGYLHVDAIFGALLCGIAVKLALPRDLFKQVEGSVSSISFSWLIPLYFAIVGLQLDLSHKFPISFFLLYLAFATVAQTVIVFLTCKLLKMDLLTSLNFGFTMNARGGPGIVLSSVAYAAGIINLEFFAVLVMLALVTSWLAGSWLRFVLAKGWRLMPGDEQLKRDRRAD